MNKSEYNILFGKRSVLCFFVIVLLMFIGALRIYQISASNYSETAKAQSSVSLNVTRPRRMIYDTNLKPMVERTSKYVAAIAPVPQAVIRLREILDVDKVKTALERLEAGKPILVESQKDIISPGITTLSIPNRYENNQPAAHIIGYLDATGHGASGIEAAYDDILYSEQNLSVLYSIDAAGRVLPGTEPEILGVSGVLGEGIALTIDLQIQQIAERASKSLDSGAVVVMEVGTGKIRAMVSRPVFNPNDISRSLKDSSSPLFNRALAAYNVGSVFKPLIAAAAIESGVSPFTQYTCTGSQKIEDIVFNCHKETGHGFMDLKSALAVSCNTYFYNLASITGPEALYNMANSLGFGQRRVLAKNIVTEKGVLTSLDKLKQQPASIANFAIGQGDLMISPVNLALLYEAIAGNGSYHNPTLIEGEVLNGKIVKRADSPVPTKVMSESTASLLKEYLINVVENGNAKNAKPKIGGAGGKTATAETGWGGEKESIVQGWFNGFYPAQNPRYIIIVLAENGESGSSNCAPVFSAIADGIADLKKE